MTWITTVPLNEATGRLKHLYDRVAGPDGAVDNIMMAHSLRPHSMEGHMALYKYVLHHTGNHIPKWFLEAIGVRVSALNDCSYCVEHHFSGLTRLIDDPDRAERMKPALIDGNFSGFFDPAQRAALGYAEALTLRPASIQESDLTPLRAAGFDDGMILEINQVTAYFCYANRTVLGLGVQLEESGIGLSPNNSDDPDDWGHK